MKQRSAGFYIGLIVTLVLGFGVVAGAWLGLRSAQALGYNPGVINATPTGSNSATLAISVFPDSMICHSEEGEPKIEWVTYCPTTSFNVPPNSLITMVITNYDGATPLVNDYFSQVRGTVGGVAMVNGKPVTQIDPQLTGHTFTLQSTPDSPHPIFVSVPLLGTADDAPNVNVDGQQYPKPNIISFQFRTGPPGTYVWHCYVPCGADRDPPYGFSGPMSTTGYMAGTMTVSS